MNKNKVLIKWLKSQSNTYINLLLYISIIISIFIELIIIVQTWVISNILQLLLMNINNNNSYFILLKIINLNSIFVLIIIRFLLNYCIDKVNFTYGCIIRRNIRIKIIDHLNELGPAFISCKPVGSWSSILIEQIEDIHDFYARYMPQIYLSVLIPSIIFIFIFLYVNWASALIIILTSPLIPLFISLVSIGAANANKRNFSALARLSGYFLDRLRGIDTIRLFGKTKNEIYKIHIATENFRKCTMEVLRIALLSSGVIEFFISISIAVISVYFVFSYIGKLHFGHYGTTNVSIFSGFMVLLLAPEFFKPLRDLGLFYHTKAQAIGAAESIFNLLKNKNNKKKIIKEIKEIGIISIIARNLIILAPDGKKILGPLDLKLEAGQKVALIGTSGIGKSSLINLLLGFLPYKGSILINGIELRCLSLKLWRERISWISQEPTLLNTTLRENILLGCPQADEGILAQAINDAYLQELISKLPYGLNSNIGEDANRLSVGQAQLVALARALLRKPDLLLLDEPTASLDINSERLVMHTLKKIINRQTTIMVTHKFKNINNFDTIWLILDGKIVQSSSYSEIATVYDTLI